MTIAINVILISLFVFGLYLANKVYRIDKNIFLYRITALASVGCAGISFVEYELSRQTNYETALELSSVHTMINALTIFFSVLSIWTFANPFPKGKYPYINSVLFALNLFFLTVIWIAELSGHHIVTTIHRNQVLWQYEFEMDRFMVKMLIVWYACQALAALFSLFQFFKYEAFSRMRRWTIRTVIMGTFLFLTMFFLQVFNSTDISKGYYFVSPMVLLSIAFYAHIYTNFKLFTAHPINAFDNILASMSNSMAIADTNFKITYLNKAARKEFNLEADALPDFTFNDVGRNLKLANWDQDAALIRKLSEEEKLTREYVLFHRGQHLYYQMTFSPVFNDVNIKTGFLVVATNITALKQSEAQLKRSNQQLKQSNAELERFAYIASHDLKTPLRTITSFLNLIERHIKRHYKDDVLDEYLRFAVDGSRQMNQLIIDVLEYSKLGREQTAQKESVDLNAVVDAACRTLEPVISEKQAQIHQDKLPTIYGDFSLLKQLFQNLIENGIKYNHSKPPVLFIKYAVQDQGHQITVRDNGIGIGEKYQDQVFEMFKRLHASPEYEGTGIGLAICKKIVQQLGGSIAVRSKEGQGSDFIIYIPKMKVLEGAIDQLPAIRPVHELGD